MLLVVYVETTIHFIHAYLSRFTFHQLLIIVEYKKNCDRNVEIFFASVLQLVT